MSDFEVVAENLEFPEGGPICLSDGSILVVEIKRGTLTRVFPDTKTSEVVVTLGGGPNSSAVGPDQKVYICQNGGFQWSEVEFAGKKVTMPGHEPVDYKSGGIQRVDLVTGKVETLFTSGWSQYANKEVQLRGPNDLTFDKAGGFYFTDHGKRRDRDRDVTGVFYASKASKSTENPAKAKVAIKKSNVNSQTKHKMTRNVLNAGVFSDKVNANGNIQEHWKCEEVAFPMDCPNGIGLSRDGKTLYVAETFTGRLYQFDVVKPGQLANKRLLFAHEDEYMFDSLAVDGDGNVVVATLGAGKYGIGGLTVVNRKGEMVKFICTNDPLTTNVAFNSKNDAVITSSGLGKILKMKWPFKTRQPNFEEGFVKFKPRERAKF